MKILIDLNSIQHNLRVGSTVSYVPGIVEEVVNSDGSISTHYNHYEIHHSAIPEYKYKYQIMNMTCNICKGTFSSERIALTDDGVDYNTCPLCGYDLDMEYETIEDALKRMSII